MVEDKLTMSQQCVQTQLCPRPHQKECKQEGEELILTLQSTLARPHLEYCTHLWCPQHKKDMELLEQVKRRVMKL